MSDKGIKVLSKLQRHSVVLFVSHIIELDPTSSPAIKLLLVNKLSDRREAPTFDAVENFSTPTNCYPQPNGIENSQRMLPKCFT